MHVQRACLRVRSRGASSKCVRVCVRRSVCVRGRLVTVSGCVVPLVGV